MTVGEIVAIVAVGLTLLGVLSSVMVLAYKMGKFAQEMTASTELGVKTYNLVSKQDERISEIELAMKDKADKITVEEIAKQVVELQTKDEVRNGG